MKVISIVKYTFASIGLAMLIATLFLYQNTQAFLSTAITTHGTVVELISSRSNDSTTYAPVVIFTASNGEMIEFISSGSNPPAYSRNETVEVLYQEKNPQNAKINSLLALWGACLIIGIMGGVFFLMGFSIIMVGRLKNQKIRHLKTNGSPVETQFQSVEINGALEVNGQNPYQILTQWTNPETGKLHIFKSENIWFDPTNLIKQKKITVLIDKNNPKKYYTDTSFLPEVAA